MKITFKDGKTFQNPNPTFEVMLRTSELLTDYENDKFLKENTILDDLITLRNYIVLLFGNQFTTEEFNTNYAPEDINEFIEFGKECLYGVVVNPKRIQAMAEQLEEMKKLEKQVQKTLKK
ncbi:hypothetical protein KG089_05175 [Carnobacteriaceae bacterium zg-ZUI252]|nr:hypothetical protein [Carnobacteriaceae bacterium zg-ZUI252]